MTVVSSRFPPWDVSLYFNFEIAVHMKYYFIFLFQLIVLSSYGQENKEAEIDSLESEMMNFFQATLERNYGRKDALDLLVKGLERYHFNYLLDVDKARLKQINEKLYAGGLLYSYFVDGAILNDSCTLFVPDGVSPSEYCQSDAYQQASKNQQEHGGSLSLVADSLQYAYMKAQVESIILPFKKRLDGFTYWQRELEPAIHPALKAYLKIEDAIGGVSSVMIFWEIARNTDHFCSDFKTDRDVRMFLTLYFWKYLCYFANIDFYTGQDKTEEILKGEAD